MSELAERFEVLVEAFARKIAALAIDAGEQKGRADRAEAEVDRLRREYEPGYPVARDASVDEPVLDEERRELCDEINKWKRRYFLVADAVAAESESAEQLADIARKTRAALAEERKRACELSTSVEDLIEQREVDAEAHAATTAKLGRAVDILEDLARRGGLGWETHERIRAILADADGTQAAEAWTAEREVIDAAKAFRASGVPHEHWVRLWNALDAVAAVDARRGAVKP